ncbi:MAG: apolipoprotein N-acyltransferase [Nitrospinota bacterium]|nr:apolipoprotein N-acyltransferase [Nitrospinota bacterium]
MQIPKNTRCYLLSICSGLMLVLIFPRFDMEPLAWFALVPLLYAIKDQSLARASLCGFITGMVFYFFGLIWVVNTIVNFGKVPVILAYPILGLLAAYLSFYISLFCFLVGRLSRNLPVYTFMLAPLVWTALEYLRSTHPQYGFSWLGLGYSQYKSLTIIQIAEYTGVYGITTLIVLVNAGFHYLIHFWLSRKGSQYSTRQAISVMGITLAVLAVCLFQGNQALQSYEKQTPSVNLQVALVQGNIEQQFKWDSQHRQRIIDTYKNLTLKGAARTPDLIVWPEAATPYQFEIDEKETIALKALVKQANTPLFFGSPYYVRGPTGVTSFNSAYLVSPGGDTLGRYDKIHLVPFGEFIPFKKLLGFVERMAQGIGNFGRGEKPTLFKAAGEKFGASICYEIIFPDLVRQPVKQGARFLVNITNDAWFGNSAASYQHIAMAALRAVENRTPIARAANTGISGVIDPSGKIRDTTDLFVEDLVQTGIHLREGLLTYYTRNGDTFSHACILLTVALVFFAQWNRPKDKKNPFSD